MKKMYGKLLSFVLAIAMVFSVPVVSDAAVASSVDKSDIVILYDNDVHCEVDGYVEMATIKKSCSHRVSMCHWYPVEILYREE